MDIGRKDVIWNFAGTFMRVASGVIVMPLVVHLLPRQEAGLWGIFLAVGGLAALLDFGFVSTFSRNITYIFSGVKELRATGYTVIEGNNTDIDYGLLKSVITAMKRYYGIITAVFLLFFFAISPFYLRRILTDFDGNAREIWTAWFTYGVLVAYQLYTYYYTSLLIGRGMVKKAQQIIIVGQGGRIVVAAVFLLLGFGIISLVIGQLVSDLITRMLSYRAFFDKDLKTLLADSAVMKVKDIMKIMAPNASKLGVTTLGGFLVGKLMVFLAPLFLALSDIALYTATTKQMVDLIVSFGMVWFGTYVPKITQHRVSESTDQLKRMYVKSKLILLGVFLVCGVGLIVVGPIFFELIQSKTPLLPTVMIVAMLLFAYLDASQSISCALLLTGNEVPYMKSMLYTGIGSVLLFVLFARYCQLGMWSLILAPGIAQLIYQDWKWNCTVMKKLQITPKDYFAEARRMLVSPNIRE